jgi:hypothetical protein
MEHSLYEYFRRLISLKVPYPEAAAVPYDTHSLEVTSQKHRENISSAKRAVGTFFNPWAELWIISSQKHGICFFPCRIMM